MRSRQGDLGHMTRHTLFFPGVAHLIRLHPGFPGYGRRYVAGETGGIVGCRRLDQLGVRIVTRGAADSAIIGIEAFAIRDAIRLEAHIQRSSEFHFRDLCPSSVTRATEFIHLFRGQ